MQAGPVGVLVDPGVDSVGPPCPEDVFGGEEGVASHDWPSQRNAVFVQMSSCVAQPKEIAREPIWVCFMGPSSLRLKAEKKASKWRAAEQSAQTRQAQAQVLACPGCGATRASATESCGACRYGLPWYRRHMIALIVGGAILFVVVMVVLPIVVGALVSFASIIAG